MKTLIAYFATAALTLILQSAAHAAIPTGHYSGEIRQPGCDTPDTSVEMLIAQKDDEGFPTYYGIYFLDWPRNCAGNRDRHGDRLIPFVMNELENGTIVIKQLTIGASGSVEEANTFWTGLFSNRRGRTRLQVSSSDGSMQMELKYRRRERLTFGDAPTIGARFTGRRDQEVTITSGMIQGTFAIAGQSSTGQFQLEPVFPGIYLMREFSIQDVTSMALNLSSTPTRFVAFVNEDRVWPVRNRTTARIFMGQESNNETRLVQRRR